MTYKTDGNSREKIIRASRTGKHLIGAHFDNDVYREFKVLSALQLKGTNEMLAEALADLFAKHRCKIPCSIAKNTNSLG